MSVSHNNAKISTTCPINCLPALRIGVEASLAMLLKSRTLCGIKAGRASLKDSNAVALLATWLILATI